MLLNHVNITEIMGMLDGYYRDAVVVSVPDDFVLDLLPALEGLVHQDLGSVGKGLRYQSNQLFFVVGEPGAQSTQSEG